MQYVEANFPPKPLTELMLAPESPLLQELLAAKNAKKSQACIWRRMCMSCQSHSPRLESSLVYVVI